MSTVPEPAASGLGSLALAEMPVAARDVFIGRQPIFDADSALYGYELLFRHGDHESAQVIDGDEATFTVMMNALLEVGLGRLVGDRRAFINVTRNSLLCEYPQFFPQEQVVLEVLEDVDVDDELVAMLRSFSRQGYSIALDDFSDRKEMGPLLEVANIIKLDVQALSPESIVRHVERFRRYKLVAEKVETREQFEFCQRLGFDYFQGYFLCRPKVVTVKHIPTSQLTTLRLLAKLYDPDVEPEDLIADISQDVALSYRLIRTVNSAQYGLRSTVDSIEQAVRALGLRRIRSWITLLSISGMDDTPVELMATAMVRGRMAEILAGYVRPDAAPQFFLVGLFSVLDGLMGCSMEELLDKVPLAPEICDALVNGTGACGQVLRCIHAYERGAWDEVTVPGVDDTAIRDAYLQAIAWADEARRSMGI